MKRVLTALVAVPILLYTVWNSTPYFFVGLSVIAMTLGLHEFYALASNMGFRPFKVGGYIGALAVAAAFVRDQPEWITAALVLLVLVSFAASLLRPAELNIGLPSVSATVLGVVYAAVLAGFLIGVRVTADTAATPKLAARLLTTFFAMVMMTDTGAYYTGRSVGRHKLAPLISPGKTVEGSIGGFASAILAGLICRLAFFPQIPVIHVILLGATIGVVSQVGDLAESLLKRGAGVKDSGSVFPGHGGMLDRLDSILFCAPILYFYSRVCASAF